MIYFDFEKFQPGGSNVDAAPKYQTFMLIDLNNLNLVSSLLVRSKTLIYFKKKKSSGKGMWGLNLRGLLGMGPKKVKFGHNLVQSFTRLVTLESLF